MRYGQIRQYDVANGEGIRTSVFVTGCTHGCKNCFNKEYQDFSAGELWGDAQTELVVQYLSDPCVAGLSLLGGEPFQNTKDLLPVVRTIRRRVSKSIWIYSGYTFEELLQEEEKIELLSLCDVLVDGRFVEEKKDLTLKFRGSSNQRLIDVKQSLREGKPVLLE
ncbi:anaerobic ribonucleoside-triphosphate reductase activating protein [Filifactor villosus]|uniref:Anaerobic ribonucleoside-triphosphate reductase-activating protein n=1 Tax=Filifactor villosus TaxID=29374 RepID=A0ABV9QMS6_9FIRM